MKIIFLDIDGVLNCASYFDDTKGYKKTRSDIDIRTLPRLRRIIEATDAKVVLSSTWRGVYPDKLPKAIKVFNLLREYGINIYDITTPMPNGLRRSEEIAEWLYRHPEITKFVVLDDEFMEEVPYIKEHLVQTSWYAPNGELQDYHADKAIEMLNKN